MFTMKIKKIIAVLFIIIVFFCIVALVYINQVGLGMKNDMEITRKAIFSVNFSCSKDTKEESAPWSKRGYSRFCTKDGALEGGWIAWEDEKLAIEGSYHNNKKHGVWRWYDKNGIVCKTIEYNDGIVVP